MMMLLASVSLSSHICLGVHDDLQGVIEGREQQVRKCPLTSSAGSINVPWDPCSVKGVLCGLQGFQVY
jgi:hypothetical protein